MPFIESIIEQAATDWLKDAGYTYTFGPEAHRGQDDFIVGYGRHVHASPPNASFMGFSGTPTGATPRAVFGDYISIYAIVLH